MPLPTGTMLNCLVQTTGEHKLKKLPKWHVHTDGLVKKVYQNSIVNHINQQGAAKQQAGTGVGSALFSKDTLTASLELQNFKLLKPGDTGNDMELYLLY